jgi:LPS sulfotransferase NodH
MSGRYKYFAIFGAMRSGSNLLEQSLNQYSGITCHGELFNPSFIGHPKSTDFLGLDFVEREKSPESLIKAMIKDAGDGIAGFRVFHDHDQRTAQMALQDPKCAKIILQRDVLQSFISLEIARKTDQWLLHDSPDRRGGKIIFNTQEFNAYRTEQEAYYEDVRKILQKSGQAAFWVHYPEQRDVAVLNGIARFLGQDEVLKTVKETIRRQNPGSLRDKVENYDEMRAALSHWSEDEIIPQASFNPLRRANIPKMVSCISQPILFVPVPGGPNEEILRWMNAIDEGAAPSSSYSHAVTDGEVLHTGHNQRTLFEWMESNPDIATLTAVRHPLTRAYGAFMAKIFPTGEGTYAVIREQLVNYFGVALPDLDVMEGATRKSLDVEGYSIGQHRAAFHGFLRFLKDNLSGQTSIRKDGLWDSQMTFLTGFNAAVPISIIVKEGQMDAGFRYIESVLDLPVPTIGAPIKPDHMFALDEIYTRQTENLARKAYSLDYGRFGFTDYQAALEV